MPTQIPKQGILRYQEVTRVRRSGGGWVNSRYVDGTEEDLSSIESSVQNPTRKGSEVIKNMPEGERLDSWKVLFCEVGTFRISDDDLNLQSDLVIWDGWYWDVRKINTWKGGVLTHDQVFCVRTNRKYTPPPAVVPVFYSIGGAFVSYDGAFATEAEEFIPPSEDSFVTYSDSYSSYDNSFSGL